MTGFALVWHIWWIASLGLICAFAAQKNYLALYLCGLGANRKEFAGLNCGKGCVRFKKLEELPLEAVTKVLLAAAAP